MSLGIKLVQAVQKEVAMKRPLPLQAACEQVLTGSGEVSAKATLCDNDRFSHLAEEVTVSISGAKPSRGSKALKPQARGERFAERATYLTESLQFVECDATGAATLRSSPSTMAAKRAAYFEAKVGNDSVSLKRFAPRENRPGRDAVPFCVTEDVLARLVDDAAAVLSPKVGK